jgi:hypothetical protein
MIPQMTQFLNIRGIFCKEKIALTAKVDEIKIRLKERVRGPSSNTSTMEKRSRKQRKKTEKP